MADGDHDRLEETDRDLIARYLADRLSQEECAVVETRIISDPEFRRELELTEALRAGLRQLRGRGEITSLLAPNPPLWQRPSFALAATLLAVAFGLVSLLLYQRLDTTRQALVTATERVALRVVAQPTHTEALRFDRTRSGEGAPAVSWRRSSAPSLLDLRFDVGLNPAADYKASVERVSPDSAAALLVVPHVGSDAGGEVMLTIHSGLLEPGDYRIRLEPQPTDTPAQAAIDYALRVLD